MSSHKPNSMDGVGAYKDVYFNASIEKQIKPLLLDYVYRQSLVGQITSLFCATILLAGLYAANVNNNILFGWYLFFVVVTLARIGLIHAYNKRSLLDERFNLWRWLFITGAFLGGISWAITGTWLFVLSNNIQQALIILVIAGITAGAAPLLAADLIADIVFLSAVLVPVIIQLAFNNQNNLYALFDVTLFAYYLYMLLLSRRAHRLLKQTIGLRFEKEALESLLLSTKSQFDSVCKQLDSVATHDLLTGLINRNVFSIKFAEAIKGAEISQKTLALLYINLDNYKFINDAYGHDIGDQLLKNIVVRIKENLSETDILARVGGDELMVILENQEDSEAIKKAAEQLCQVLTKQFVISSYHITISASIGVSIYPVDGVTSDVLLKKADSALRYVKEHGRNNFRFSTNLREIKNFSEH